MTTSTALTQERADLLDSLRTARYHLRNTLRDLDDEQCARRTTPSELSLAGIIKHVTLTEGQWARFIVEGPSAFPSWSDPDTGARWMAAFRMSEDETVAGLLAAYESVAANTDELVSSLPDLDADHPLPPAPWWRPGARWSARRVVHHIVAETAQHAGHADIIREALDGAKSMG